MSRGSTACIAALLPLLAFAAPAAAATPAKTPKPRMTLTLSSSSGGERAANANDLTFVFFRRTYYQKAARRSESPSGQRIEVEDRRRECACLRFADWSKIKFKNLRQIEISYPAAPGAARVRVTFRNGKVREFAAADLYGGDGTFIPRLAATLDGAQREFPLVANDDAGSRWPDELLVRVLFLRR